MKNQELLRDIQSNNAWIAIEEALKLYLDNLDKFKPDMSDQFKLTWSMAHNQGGIDHLKSFFALIDSEARKC